MSHGNLRLAVQQVADDALRLVLTLHRGGDDLVEGGLHAVEPAQPTGIINMLFS
jgi:hypothetical protein